MRAIYFGGDITNPTLILRITSLRSAGIELQSFTFRRRKFNTDFLPDWPNHALGYTSDRKYSLRIIAILRACRIIIKNKAAFEGTDFLYARMIDMALLAQFAKWWFKLESKLVYEVEDVQAIFFKNSISGRIFRRLERWLLCRTQLLVVMSPGFLRGYFAPVQHYSGPFFVLENKLQLPAQVRPATPAANGWQNFRDKWIIGWFGTLRCERSMQILSDIATRLGDRVEIRTRGFPTETGLAHYLKFVNAHSNWHYEGEYKIPDDLEEMYGGAHFTWCLDFLDTGGNSELLLACRMYQGGFYGSVPLVAKNSEMRRFLAPHAIGHGFDEPYAENISAFLEHLTWAEYKAERERVVRLGRDLFLDTGADVERLIDAIEHAPTRPDQRSR